MTKKIKRIAIIEDEHALLIALKEELCNTHFDIVSAMDGEAGLDLIKKEKPDLVLLDIVLPKMDGFSVLKELKKCGSTKHIPVIILTNLGQEDEKKQGLKLGAKDYFVKASMDLEQISKKINQALS